MKMAIPEITFILDNEDNAIRVLRVNIFARLTDGEREVTAGRTYP